ncbi:MAG: HDOD domain-containing protein [Opitutaceae bacterium]|nr:HDOD domain-containing protein [Opitutaceae bacterium]
MTRLHPPTLKEVCTQALSLPCSPALLPRLIAALQREEATASEIEAIIRLDSALAAATLRLANSAALGGGREVDSLEGAILRLGQREIFRLAALALVNRWESSHGAALRWEPGDFCRHALCTALAAEALAEQTGRVDPQQAYAAGLVTDIGKLALAHACASFYPGIRAFCEQTRCTWEQAEKSVLGYHHAEVGAALLRAWHFPEVFALCADHRVHPATAPAAAQPLLAHVHAATYIATAMGPGANDDSFCTAVPGAFLRDAGFTLELLELTMAQVLPLAHARLGDRLTHGAVAF